MRDIKIACVCMHSEVGQVERNLGQASRLIDQAMERGAEIICLPEASISGYIIHNPSTIYDAQCSESIIARITEMAKSKGVVLLAGLIEIGDSRGPFISHVVAGPEGLIGIYRKTHLSPMEQGSFQAGENLEVFEYDEVAFGIQLCWEAHFPEISTVMALKGAELIFMPHASPRTSPQEKLGSWLRHMRSRAFDNALYIAACNQVGQTREDYVFPGVAVIIAPSGQVIVQRAEEREGMVVGQLRADEIERIKSHRLRFFLPSRRPELYKLLVQKDQLPKSHKSKGNK